MSQIYMNLFFLWVILFISVPALTTAQTYYYYTGPSPTIGISACPVSNCSQCATGFYNLNCGIDSTHINPDQCTSCGSPPSNAYWLAWGSQSSVGISTAVCQWGCNNGYNKTGGTCVATNCSVPTGNKELSPGTLYPICDTRCMAGYYGSPTLNPSTCTQCSNGYYSDAGSSTCTGCPLGKYLPVGTVGSGISSCVTAPAGSYVASVGSTTFTNCSAGTWSNTLGGTSSAVCQPCTAGNYCPAGSSNPIPCPTGTFNPSPSASACTSCPAGTYIQSTGQTSCTNCSAGTYSAATGASSSTVCSTCTTGNYCPSGSSAPILCDAGYYNPSQGGISISNCIACPTNTYSSSAGAASCTNCTLCSTGQYKTGCGGANAGSCTQCYNIV